MCYHLCLPDVVYKKVELLYLYLLNISMLLALKVPFGVYEVIFITILVVLVKCVLTSCSVLIKHLQRQYCELFTLLIVYICFLDCGLLPPDVFWHIATFVSCTMAVIC